MRKILWKKFFREYFPYLRRVLPFIYVLLLVSVIYHVYYAKKIIPGVFVGSVNVGGLSYDAAKKSLENATKDLDKKLTLVYQDRSFEISPETIGFSYDLDSAISRAFEVGRTKNLYIDTKDKLAGFFKKLYIGAYYDYDDYVLQNELSVIKGEMSVDPIDAKFLIKDGTLAIEPSKNGQKIYYDGLFTLVVASFDRMSFGTKDLPVISVSPKISEEDLKSQYDTVKNIVDKNIKVVHQNKTWALTKQQLLELLTFSKDSGKLKLSVGDANLIAFMETLEKDVNILPRGKVTRTDGTKVLSFELTQEGVELNTGDFEKMFKDALFSDQLQATLTVPTRIISKLADTSRYGIYSLLGEGKSRFAGSSRSRINNLTLAAKRTDGVLIPPGEIYSMNKAIGEISAANGYDTAYIIQEGRTVLGEGGGVCQTSTTLFRAVLNAGLPIVMRYPHDYRVYYYEMDSDVGFDASIFQPSMDFQFKNDSPNYVLIQTTWNLDDSSLNFRIYGTPDNRTVEITKPVVTNVSPPPETLYQDDPTLPKGVTKQVDFSAWGASVSFSRKVFRNNEVISDSTFVSRYRPWRAIYLVGTKE